MIYAESFKAQLQLEKLIQSMIASGIITDIPRMEYSTIELSTIKMEKSSTITAKCITCSIGKKEETKMM